MMMMKMMKMKMGRRKSPLHRDTRREKLRSGEVESKRRSGRERKVPKKFEVEVHKKKKKKKKVETESSGNEDFDSDYESRKKKKAKKKIDKFNIYKKSPTKMK